MATIKSAIDIMFANAECEARRDNCEHNCDDCEISLPMTEEQIGEIVEKLKR